MHIWAFERLLERTFSSVLQFVALTELEKRDSCWVPGSVHRLQHQTVSLPLWLLRHTRSRRIFL